MSTKMSVPDPPPDASGPIALQDFVEITEFNRTTGIYEARRVPLWKAYQDAVEKLEHLESKRQKEADRLEAEDATVWHRTWQQTMEMSNAFQAETIRRFKETLDSAQTTYRTQTAMSITLFIAGIGLFIFAALYATLAHTKIYSLVFAGMGGATFVALFILAPFEKAQSALSDLIQGEVAFMAFFEQIRLWTNYPWEGGVFKSSRAQLASDQLQARTAELMADLEKYLEPDDKRWWRPKDMKDAAHPA